MAAEESIACKTNLDRLQSLHHQALRQCRVDIDRWRKFKADYEAVQSRLVMLPDQFSYDVMVPLGQHALMPGQLVHTNEVLVSLGDNWFVHCSAKQSVDIVRRRVESVNEELARLAQQLKDLEARVEFTSDINQTLQGGLLEIREECVDEEQHDPTVAVRRSKHKINNSQHKPSNREEKKSHGDIMAQLDELEKEETKCLEDIGDSQKGIDQLSGSGKKRGSNTESPPCTVIKFQHTPKEQDGPCSTSPSRQLGSISSPGEITRSCHECHLSKTCMPADQSASSNMDIKKVRFAENLTTAVKGESAEGTTSRIVKPSQSPFSGVVVEKQTNVLKETTTIKQQPRSSEFKRAHQTSS